MQQIDLGTKDGFPEYCANKLNPENAHLIHEDLRPIFKTTNLILLYQEQVLQIFRYAGFPETEVDNARRAIGKKKLDVMAKLETDFREKLSAKGWTTEQLDQLWELILKQTGYSFNRGHSVSYGLLSYLTAYLKYHYPVAFMTACLNADSGDVSRIGILINECYKLGIDVLPPQINNSRKDFTAVVKDDEILFGLQAIKGLGESIVAKILENKPYTGLKDFIERSGCSKSHIVQLIKSGAFGSNEKHKKLLTYFNAVIDKKEYKPVKTIPSPKEATLLKYGIDPKKFNDPDKKKNNADLLEAYIHRRKKQFDDEQNLKVVKDYVTDWNDVNQGAEGVLLAVVVDLKRKKDKNNNVFAYIDLYTINGIIESVAWSSIFKTYGDLLQKGKCIALLGRKGENNQMFIKEVKDFQVWLKARKEDLKENGGF